MRFRFNHQFHSRILLFVITERNRESVEAPTYYLSFYVTVFSFGAAHWFKLIQAAPNCRERWRTYTPLNSFSNSFNCSVRSAPAIAALERQHSSSATGWRSRALSSPLLVGWFARHIVIAFLQGRAWRFS
jgi:hypothetical protein